MDEKPTDDASSKGFNQLDLSHLESFSFGTQWSEDKSSSDDSRPRREDRARTGGPRPDRKDRRSFKRPAGPPAGGDAGGERPPRGDRRPGGPGGSRGPRDRFDRGGRGEGGPGGGGRGGQFSRPPAPYISPYFDVTFYPEDVSFAALAKTIRASCRTFELFDIAKTVIGKHDRFVVVIERKREGGAPAEKRPFYVTAPDSLPFESEEDAINHIFRHHLDKFFATEQVETEPPKGSFQVINKCGYTGELLGPPNYHRYNEIAQQHHATKVARVPFDVFLSRVETVRDPEVVQQWLDSMKTTTRYTWIYGTKPAVKTDTPVEAEAEAPAEAAEPAPPKGAETAEAPAVEASEAEPTPEPAAETAAAAEPVEAAQPEESTAVEAEAETEAPEAEAAEPAAEEPVPATSGAPTFDSLSAARVHLLTHARDKAVRTYEAGRFHGRELAGLPDGEIKRAVLGTLERQQRFPLDTANALRGRLRREGFTIFKKGSKGVSYVCAVKRKFRVPGQKFADSIGHLITFIEQHPNIKVSELPEQLLGIKLPEAPAQDAPADTPAPAPLGAEEQASLKRLQTDLRWLVTEGYVTEFIDGSIFAPPPMPEPKAADKADKPAKASTEEADAAETETEEESDTEAEESAPEADRAPAEVAGDTTPDPEVPAAAAPEAAPVETPPAPEPAPGAEVEPAPAPEPAAEEDDKPKPPAE